MEFIFEIVFEVLFELIFEGTLTLGTSKKVCMPVRILVMAVFVLLVGGILALVLWIALSVMKSSALGGWALIALDLALLGGAVYGVWKKIKNGGSE